MFANIVDPDQLLHCVVSDLGQLCSLRSVFVPVLSIDVVRGLLTCVMLNKLMPLPLLVFSQSDYLIQVFDTNLHT